MDKKAIALGAALLIAAGAANAELKAFKAVSYTHLTLPTNSLV